MVAAIANGVNGRRTNGQFEKGHAGGPGNPHNKRIAELRRAVLDAVDTDDVALVVIAMRDKAIEERDPTAARVFLEYTLGKPTQGIELTGKDGGPVRTMTDAQRVDRAIELFDRARERRIAGVVPADP